MKRDPERIKLQREVYATLDSQSALNLKMNYLINEITKKHNISRNAYHIMRFVKKYPDGVEPSVIAENLSMLRQSVSNLVFEMEKNGFVVSKHHPVDRRRVLISLTPEGASLEKKLSAEMRDLHNSVFAHFTNEEMRTYLDLRTRIIQCMQDAINETLHLI